MATELTQEQIVQALNESPDLLTGVASHIITTDKGTEIVTNRANQIYDEKIGEEIKRVHGLYDENIFKGLGEKPGVGEDGNKVKSYVFVEQIATELKELRGQKESLTRDAEIQRLTQELEQAKEQGGGGHWKQTFETEQQKWMTEKESLTGQLDSLKNGMHTSAIEGNVDQAKAGLKFNPDIPESAINAMYATIKSDLVKNSKKDGEKIVFLNKEGGVISDAEFKPANAEHILKERMKDVLLKNDVPGGGAQETIVGSIKTTTVEGKDEKSLVLDATQFKNRVEFMEVAKKALKAEGIARTNADFQPLLDKAYKDYKVDTLPRS